MNSSMNTSLRLVKAGISVLPLAPSSKIPLWKALPLVEDRNGEMKPKWEPFQSRLATEEEILGWFECEPNANIGLICGKISGIVAVDVDGEEGAAWFAENMPKPLMIQYSRADNPNRFHALYAHPMNCLVPPSVKALHPQIDIRGDGSYIVFAPSIHPSTRQPYRLAPQTGYTGMKSLSPLPYMEILQKGLRSDSGAITDGAAMFVPDEEESSLSRFLAPVEEGTRNATMTSFCGNLFRRLPYADVEVMARMFNSTFPNPLPEHEVSTIVRSVQRYHTDVPTSPDNVKAWIDSVSGNFTLTDMYRELKASSQDEMEACRATVKELLFTGVIEINGSKYGQYRKVDNARKYVDLNGVEEDALDIALPLGLSGSCEIQRKNIVIVAGETNAGKTAWLFEFCRLNLGKRRINYITSEMTSKEINSRINRITNYGDRSDWDNPHNIQFQERQGNYHEVLDADNINIVDFLEVCDDFSKVAGKITACFNKLNDGICIIALQKKKGEDFGRGGEFTLEKARLALSLYAHGHTDDSVIGSCKVVKCKNFREGMNPDGKERFYRLRLGTEYTDTGIANVPTKFARLTDKSRNRAIQNIEAYCEYVQDNPIQPQPEQERVNPLW